MNLDGLRGPGAGSRRAPPSGGRLAVRAFLAAALFLVPLASAHAYVDPGTGSMIVQVLIAALVGGAAVLGAFWRKLFRRRRSQAGTEPDQDKD
jgi:hypothetical protein